MKILLASLLLFMSFSSNALTGNELYEKFNEFKKEPITSFVKAGHFQGYVIGVIDVYVKAGVLCWPDGAINGQAFDIVGSHLKDNAGVRHLNAVYLVVEALEDIFICEEE